MNIYLVALLFVVGVVFVVKGGDLFVDAASNIATSLHIPKFLIGATIVSIATTLPELMVSSIAAYNGQVDMAVGNAVGSVIANQGLIMATAMLFMNYICRRRDYLIQSMILIFTVAMLWLFGMDGQVELTANIIFICVFFIYMYINVYTARKAQKNRVDSDEDDSSKTKLGKTLLVFLLGATMIVIGSRFMVDNGTLLAKHFGVAERVIAVTMVAIGTSLPELVTTVSSIIKKEPSLSIGNIIGANILNITMVMPIASLVSGSSLMISKASANFDLPYMVGITLLALLPIIIKEKSYKWQGFAMLGFYIVYLIMVI